MSRALQTRGLCHPEARAVCGPKNPCNSPEATRLQTDCTVSSGRKLRVPQDDMAWGVFPLLLLSAACQKISPDKGLQIAVEDAVDIADLSLGPMVFDHAVR